MATTQEELDTIKSENERKKRLIAEEQRKAAALQGMVENDTTKAALSKESDRLDSELAKAKAKVEALEKASGVTADSLKLSPVREMPVAPPTSSAIDGKNQTGADEGAPSEAAVAPAKRGQK